MSRIIGKNPLRYVQDLWQDPLRYVQFRFENNTRAQELRLISMDYTRRPSEQECFGYHRNYVANVSDGDILQTLEAQLTSVPAFIRALPEDQLDVVHAPYGWRIRTVVEHCCDAERVFGYRALRFATGDKTELPGWDENYYAACGYSCPQSTGEIAGEFASLRSANLCLFKRLNPDAFDRLGVADGKQVSVRTLAWLMAGHWLHHAAILRKRLSLASV
jgi:hypothetical protein